MIILYMRRLLSILIITIAFLFFSYMVYSLVSDLISISKYSDLTIVTTPSILSQWLLVYLLTLSPGLFIIWLYRNQIQRFFDWLRSR
jgi:hypothetical protein